MVKRIAQNWVDLNGQENTNFKEKKEILNDKMVDI